MTWTPSKCRLAAGLALLLPALVVVAKSCPTTVSSGDIPAPSVAKGYSVNLVSNDLQDPRGIIFDAEGHLLVVDAGHGVYHLGLNDDGMGCVTQTSKTAVVEDSGLNHGIAFSLDGKTLYASTPESVYSWPYDPKTAKAMASKRTTIVNNMTTNDHTTRTLVMSKKEPGILLVTRGSTANIDPQAKLLSSGHSQIKAFNLANQTTVYDFVNDGKLIGWGLRNDVGLAEEPLKGGLYSVENSVDQMHRLGKDIHENNPGEEMNYFGTLVDNKSPNLGSNFGYPQCYSAWDVKAIPMNKGLKVGMQFAIGSDNIAKKDEFCRKDRTAPRLVFQAHMAPLDIKFNTAGSEAWVTFHGSWDRTDPVGYKVVKIRFANGEPVEPSTSLTAALDVVRNQDSSQCPNRCFRPVGLAWDSKGRLYFSSDQTGQIYIITTDKGKDGAVDGGVSTSIKTPPGPGLGSSTSGKPNVANLLASGGIASVLIAVFAAAFMLM